MIYFLKINFSGFVRMIVEELKCLDQPLPHACSECLRALQTIAGLVVGRVEVEISAQLIDSSRTAVKGVPAFSGR
jgi:hypothetical protein